MDSDDFEQAVLFAFVRANKRQMDAIELMTAVFNHSSSTVKRARELHDEGLKQSVKFLHSMQRIEDQGLVTKVSASTPLGDGDNPESLSVFRYELTDRVNFARTRLTLVTSPGG